jgi:hypothetical protein
MRQLLINRPTRMIKGGDAEAGYIKARDSFKNYFKIDVLYLLL